MLGKKAKAVMQKLRAMKLPELAIKVEDALKKPLPTPIFLSRIGLGFGRTTSSIASMAKFAVERRTRGGGAFPDGNSALMLVCARFHHVAGPPPWGNKKYMNMKPLDITVDNALMPVNSFSSEIKT